MKLYFLLIPIMLLGLISNGQAQSFSLEKNRPVLYQSFGNRIGEIGLVLYANQKFKIYFDSFQDGKNKTLKGKWSKRSKKYKLVFKGEPNFDQLFPQRGPRSKSFTVVNGKTVIFSTEDTGIWIWGIHCMKQ